MENNDKNILEMKEQATQSALNDATDDASVNLTDEQAIDLFVEGLIEEKGLKSDSEELKKNIFADLKTRLMEEIDRALVAELPDEKLDELSKEVAKSGKIDAEIVAKAVEEAGINVEEVVGMTMAKFRDIYLGAERNGEE